jgi:hypothetical protein
MHSPTAFAGVDRDVARKNGWPVLVSASNMVASMCGLSEDAPVRFPAILAVRARDGEERS